MGEESVETIETVLRSQCWMEDRCVLRRREEEKHRSWQ